MKKVKSALEQTIAAVAAAKKEGATLAQTVERVQLPELRNSFAGDVELRRAGYEAFFRTSLMRNVWEELDAGVMAAAKQTATKKVSEGVYQLGKTTALLNEKDVVLVNPPASAAAARATVRAMRELTDKPVRYVVLTAAKEAGPGVDVFREVYKDAEVVAAESAGANITVSDVLSLHRGARAIRISRSKNGLVVEVPKEGVRVQ